MMKFNCVQFNFDKCIFDEIYNVIFKIYLKHDAKNKPPF